jgi:hypothetical protein
MRSNVPIEERFEGICELKKMPAPGTKRPVAKIDQKIKVARSRAECVSRSRTENFQTLHLKRPAKLDESLELSVESWKRLARIHHLNSTSSFLLGREASIRPVLPS